MKKYASSQVSPYQMAINNVARKIRQVQDEERDGSQLNAFNCSIVLGAAFCKNPADVVADLLKVKV